MRSKNCDSKVTLFHLKVWGKIITPLDGLSEIIPEH